MKIVHERSAVNTKMRPGLKCVLTTRQLMWWLCNNVVLTLLPSQDLQSTFETDEVHQQYDRSVEELVHAYILLSYTVQFETVKIPYHQDNQSEGWIHLFPLGSEDTTFCSVRALLLPEDVYSKAISARWLCCCHSAYCSGKSAVWLANAGTHLSKLWYGPRMKTCPDELGLNSSIQWFLFHFRPNIMKYLEFQISTSGAKTIDRQWWNTALLIVLHHGLPINSLGQSKSGKYAKTRLAWYSSLSLTSAGTLPRKLWFSMSTSAIASLTKF